MEIILNQIINLNFQSDSKRSGDEYEAVVEADLLNRGFEIMAKDFHIEGTGCEVDFVVGAGL